jgi:hypothetical protein
VGRHFSLDAHSHSAVDVVMLACPGRRRLFASIILPGQPALKFELSLLAEWTEERILRVSQFWRANQSFDLIAENRVIVTLYSFLMFGQAEDPEYSILNLAWARLYPLAL